jgi:rubrerythrin
MTVMDDIDADRKVFEKLRKAVERSEGVTLSAGEAKRIRDHIKWLGDERESLLNSGVFDDD